MIEMKNLDKCGTELVTGYYYSITDSMYGGYYGELWWKNDKVIDRVGTAHNERKRRCRELLEILAEADEMEQHRER